MSKGIFLTFEGAEGCGKTTQSKKADAYFRGKGYNVVYTREPGGTRLGEQVREILLAWQKKIYPAAELLLYQSARAQHISEVIKPALSKGYIVICDRFTDSTLAYQSFGRGLNLKLVKQLNSFASGGIKPDLTIYIDAPLKKALEAAKKISKLKRGDRMEREGLTFHKRVKKGFDLLAAGSAGRIKKVKQAKSENETFELIKIELDKFMLKRAGG